MITLRRQGIRWRMAMLYLSIFGVGLAVFCTVLYQYFISTQIQAFDTTLYNFAVDISANLELDPAGRLVVVNSSMSEAGKLFPFHLGGSFLEIRDAQGKPMMHSRSLKSISLPLDDSMLRRLEFEKAIFQNVRTDNLGVESTSVDLRLVTYLARHPDWQQPLIVQVAVPLDLPHQEQRDLLLFFFVGVPIFLLIAGIAGIWMSRRALKPVHDMTLKAGAITGVGNLGERIPVPEAQDEIRELADTFNGLLDRLDKAFASQDRFIANASHQLRTPLTILKGELELLRKSSPSPADTQLALESVGVEINRLIQLVHDLLLLARLEAGQVSIALTPVRGDGGLLRVGCRLHKMGRKKKVQISTHFSSELPGSGLEGVIKGDEALLDSMFENFVENAVKYAPENSVVDLAMSVNMHSILVRVTDAGPGIPADLRLKIFERFTRVQPSHIVPGSGLGLSIASEIAHLHRVKIELSSGGDGKGTVVSLTFSRA